jgi:Multicopper oxidase
LLSILVINKVNHPFHLHGYQVFVMGMGQHPDKIPMTVELAKELARSNRLEIAKTRQHVIKDTISIPSRGYAVFRFKADNPGWWLLHCHFGKVQETMITKMFNAILVYIDWDLVIGMGLVVQVGEVDEMVKAPKDFSKCGNFQPDVNFS